MRKSIISSLIATVVAIANDRLVDAGLVAGAGLRRNSMREHLGNWHEPMLALLEPCYSATCGLKRCSTRLPNVQGDILNVVSQLWQRSSKRSMQHAYAFSPAYAATARVASRG